ncbi:MAG: hypothetical protein J7578_25470, partial [Chitinophagaceae bacterium]|nr:hypothetical protein [Chitinophagaceae bacterium]
RESLTGVIYPGLNTSVVSGATGSDLYWFIKQFPAKKINDIFQPRCNSMSVEQQHQLHKI